MAKSKADQIADRLATPTARVPAVRDADLLSTGCTVLNMALAGRPHGGVPKGTYLSLVGDSGSAKSWLTFCLFAEAARNPAFDGYRFVHDNAENGALMDVAAYFGPRVVARLDAPARGAAGSSTVEEFYYHVETNVRRGPCIYVLDSMDALQAEAEDDNFEAKLHHHETGKGADKIKGSMGMAKAKANSGNISRIANVTLRTNGSILVIISQTRDALNAPYPGMKTYGGGRALKFYAHQQAWTKVKAPIKKAHKGKDREIGALIAVDVQKNRVSGWEGQVPPIVFLKGYGLDDVGTNIAYLRDERGASGWKSERPEGTAKRPTGDDDEPEGKTFAAPEFDFVGTQEELVKHIQDTGREAQLADVVAGVWRAIAAGAAPVRKPRYSE